MILQKLLRLKLIQLVKTKLIFFLPFFLISCFGPVKDLKYQIEDSFEDSDLYINNPNPINNDLKNSFILSQISSGSFPDSTKINLKLLNKNDLIVYASAIGNVFALNFKKNDFVWTYSHNKEITSGLSSNKDLIFFVDYDGYLIALSFEGNLEWKTYVGEVFSAPLSFDEYVIVKNSNNNFILLDLIDGSVKWNYQVPKSPLPTRSWGGLVQSEGIIYSGIGSGKVVAINSKNGLFIWETTYSPPKGVSEIERSNDTTSDVVVDEFAVYVVSSNGNIAALNKLDGSILWKRALSSFNGLILHKDLIYVTHNSGAIYCVDKNSQKVLWRNSDLLGRDVSKGYVFKDYLIVSDYEGYIHFLSLNNGVINARFKFEDGKHINPISLIDGENLFLTSIKGDYYWVKSKLNNYDKPQLNINNNEKNNILLESDDINENKTKEDNEDLLDKLIFWD